jgi:hypothetical protein
MDVKEIPLLVFDEMSGEFGGQGDEFVIRRLSRDYRVRELKDKGFIAYAEDFGYPNSDLKSKSTHFEIWSHLSSEFQPDIVPVFEIVASPISDGSWVYGSGRFMKEDAIAHFTHSPVYLRNPLITVIGSALLFTQTIAFSSDCQRAEYWEADRCPEGTYAYPP